MLSSPSLCRYCASVSDVAGVPSWDPNALVLRAPPGSHFEGIVPRRHRLGRCPDQQGSLVEGSVTPIPIRIFLFASLGLLSLWRWDLAFYRESHAVGAWLK